jgi:hypothetical protein
MPSFPLRIGHLEQINLRHCASNVEQHIDSAKSFERPPDNGFCRLWLTQVESKGHRFGSTGPYVGRSCFQVVLAPCHQHNAREIASEADGRGSSYPLTCTGDDGDRFSGHSKLPFVSI